MGTRHMIARYGSSTALLVPLTALLAVPFLFTAGGCGGEPGGAGGGGDAGGTGATAGTGGTGGGGPTDAEVCEDACSTMILDCGVAYDSTCPDGCLASDVFLPCAKLAGTDCNELAQCAFDQGCGALTPAGSGTCKAAQDCQASQCIGNPDLSCPCQCAAGMSPGNAIYLLSIDQCSTAKCGFPCGPMGNATDCGNCILSQCATENDLCQTH